MKEIYSNQLKETIYFDKLKNGLNIMIMPREGYYRKYAIMAANFGANDLTFSYPNKEKIKVPEGIAHFLEHKLFEDKEGDVLSRFASSGASANAFTNYTTTAYLFSTTTNFHKSLLNLIDFVQTPHFTDKGIKTEKEIIAQEINMYNDKPDYQVYSNLLTAMYKKHPVRNDIAGTLDSIMKISKDNLYFCYNNFYHPENMVLFMIGDINIKETISLIKDNQSQKKFQTRRNIKKIYPEEPSDLNKTYIEKKMEVSRPLLRMGIKERVFPKNPRQLLKQDLSVKILLEMLAGKSSSLYQSLYTQGLIDDTFLKYYNLEKSYGYSIIGAETDTPDRLYDELKDGLLNGEKTITTNKLQDMSNKIIGNYVTGFNSFDKIAAAFVDYHFKSINYFELLDVLEEIDINYLKKRYHQLFENDIVCSVITS